MTLTKKRLIVHGFFVCALLVIAPTDVAGAVTITKCVMGGYIYK